MLSVCGDCRQKIRAPACYFRSVSRFFGIKITYDFFEVMFQVVTAMLCGMKTWDEIEAFGEDNVEWFRKFSPYLSDILSQAMIARIVGLVGPDEFSLCFTQWCNDN